MATVSQVLRTNIENAINELKEFNYNVKEKVKVKALGGGEYRIWCGTWDYEASAEDVLDEDLMHDMVLSFTEWAIGAEVGNIATVNSRDYGSYHNYSLVAGDADDDFSSDVIETIDGKISNYNTSAVEIFWDHHYSDLVLNLDEVIGDSPLVVYHRKGKDWHIAPELSYIEIPVYVLDEYREINEDHYHRVEGEIAHSTEGLEEKIAEIASMIRSSKDNVEIEGVAKSLLYKTSSMESFLTDFIDEEEVEMAARDFCYRYYQENNKEFPDYTNHEVFTEFLGEFDMFKHQPELALIGSSKLYRLGEKLGFYTQFEFSNDTVSVEFVVGEEEYSIHVDANEFEEHDLNWMTVYRQVVIPQVNRRRFLAQLSSIKRQIGGDLKSFAKKVWVRFEDSLIAGNCRFGSENFLRRHNISLESLGAIRGDWLLEMESTVFTQRIIYSAAAQHPELLEA